MSDIMQVKTIVTIKKYCILTLIAGCQNLSDSNTSKTQMILSHDDSEEDSTDVPNIFKQCMCFYKVSNSVCVSIRFQTVYMFL